MRSSTSSSDPSLATWLGALAVAAALVGFVELRLRGAGWTPSRRDDAAAWSVERRRIAGGDASEVVLAGSSRAAFLDEAALRDGLGASRVVNLALDGASPLPVLEHLASDARFRGTVVCDVVALRWLDEDEARATVAVYDGEPAWHAPFTAAEGPAQDSLAARHPRMTVPRFLASGFAASPPDAPATSRDAHRFEHWNPAAAPGTVARLRGEFVRAAESAAPLAPDAVAASLVRFRDAVDRLVVRGATVVLVKLPSAGTRRDAEERRFPAAALWDRLAATPGVTAFDCAAHPELGRFDCPDDSHLSAESSPTFTAALAAALRASSRR